MIVSMLSRRRVLNAGAFTLMGALGLMRSARAEEKGSNLKEPLRTYYLAWEKKDWNLMDGVLADGFTFSSPNHDDHIPKHAFKERCWPQVEFIERFELESMLTRSDEAFVKYLCRTTKGTAFRNVEFYQFTAGKIQSIECYFGGAGFPSASISAKS